jgi:hypothetical protein
MTCGGSGQSLANIEHHLRGVDFPASKRRVLERARDNGAGQDVLEVLESCPGENFGSLSDLLEASGSVDQIPQTGIIDRKP